MAKDEWYKYFESVFYDEEGNFLPMEGEFGNTIEELSEFRDTVMGSEKDYFLKLLSVDSIRNMFIKFLDRNPEELLMDSQKVMEMIEYGLLESQEELNKMKEMTPQERDLYHLRKLIKAEGLMILLAAAAKDKAKLKSLVHESEKGLSR